MVIDRDGKRDLWGRFCQTHRIADAGVPLFDMADDGAVRVFAYGRDGRPMLGRSPAMEAMVIAGVEAVLAAPPDQAEGILYSSIGSARMAPWCPSTSGRRAGTA